MFLYVVYVSCFTAAVFAKDSKAAQWFFNIVGSICGGLGAGVLWTAQGGYFASTATLLAEAVGASRAEMTSALSGQFAFVYLCLEVSAKLGFTGLKKLDLLHWEILLIFTALALLSLLGMSQVYQLRSESCATSVNCLGKRG